jgi:hypothetical protein
MLVATRDRREVWLDGTASSSNGAMVEKEWTSLWHTPVPAKIKMFLWRLMKKSLPTNDLRHRRHMAGDDICQLCGATDSWRHALLECMMSRCVWALVDEEVTKHMHSMEERGAREWLATLRATLNHDDQIRVFVTLWAIWHARRKAIHEQRRQSPLSMHDSLRSLWRTSLKPITKRYRGG